MKDIKMTIIVTFLLLATTMIHRVVQALPNGSPVCTVGEAAPGGPHPFRSIKSTGPISLGNFTVTIGSNVLDSTKINIITSGTDLSFNVSSTTGIKFRGVLMVVNQAGVNLTSNLNATIVNVTGPLFKPQADCVGMGYSGFTHTTRDDKSSVTGTIQLPTGQAANLDVNIVLFVNSIASFYYYTQFKLVGSSPTSAPIPTAPVKPPTNAPVKPPTKAPVKPPTTAPVKPTTNSTTAPTVAPIRESCGLLGLSILCLDGCGVFGRIFGLCD